MRSHFAAQLTVLLLAPLAALFAQTPVGTQGRVGCLANPKTVSRLEITQPGVYENYLFVNGKATPGYENTGEREAPAIESLLTRGFPSR